MHACWGQKFQHLHCWKQTSESQQKPLSYKVLFTCPVKFFTNLTGIWTLRKNTSAWKDNLQSTASPSPYLSSCFFSRPKKNLELILQALCGVGMSPETRTERAWAINSASAPLVNQCNQFWKLHLHLSVPQRYWFLGKTLPAGHGKDPSSAQRWWDPAGARSELPCTKGTWTREPSDEPWPSLRLWSIWHTRRSWDSQD